MPEQTRIRPSSRPQQTLRAQRTPAERASRIRFRRAMALLLMTLVLPGSAQMVAGNRRVGRVAIWTTIGLAVTALLAFLISLVWHGLLFKLGTTPWLLGLFRVVLIVLALGWAALFVDAWRLGQPLSLDLRHRRLVVAVNGALAFSVAATLLFGSHLVGVHQSMIETMFAGAHSAKAHDGRFNILLIGDDSDGGKTRWGLRTDSMTVASIDAVTGKTVLIGLPRNLQDFPFRKGSPMAKQFPHGYNCSTCLLNSVSTYVGDHKSLYADSKYPGVDATVDAVEGITGLPMSYWAMVDLNGFQKIVNALGGVTLDVREPIPVGIPGDKFYTHLKTGTRKLDGWEALWYARARHDSDDYSRMARQKCVMNAILQQTSPADVVRHYEALADAAGSTITTSVPPGEIQRFVDLATKAKSQKMSTLSLVPPLVNPSSPNITKLQGAIKDAIKAASPKPGSLPTGSPSPAKAPSKAPAPAADDGGPVTGGSLGSLQTGYKANKTDDLSSAC
ncbi:MAG: LCP family protein [Nocardioides sp.]|nr:LCP family protein [Nocardioides sp.]